MTMENTNEIFKEEDSFEEHHADLKWPDANRHCSDSSGSSSAITIRDTFAMAALSAMDEREYNGSGWAESIAEYAYSIADAMIAKRKNS